jgi:hypothetical protein
MNLFVNSSFSSVLFSIEKISRVITTHQKQITCLAASFAFLRYRSIRAKSLDGQTKAPVPEKVVENHKSLLEAQTNTSIPEKIAEIHESLNENESHGADEKPKEEITENIAAVTLQTDNVLDESQPSLIEEKAKEEKKVIVETTPSHHVELTDEKKKADSEKMPSPGPANQKKMAAIKTRKEKLSAKKNLRNLSQNGINVLKKHSEGAKKELELMFSEDKRNVKFSEAFDEFIKNEINFKLVLEDLQAYQIELDDLIKHPKEIERMRLPFTKKHIKTFNANLLQFVQVLKVIGPFADKIKDYSIQNLPEFAQIYLETDFSPMLNVTGMQQQFNELVRASDKIQKDALFKTCRKVRQQNVDKFKDKRIDIDGLVANVFQRIPRYALTLKALLDHTEKDTALFQVVNQCHLYAAAWVETVNAWHE